jgi:hypothetical protein
MDLALGVRQGDLLMLHASLRRLGLARSRGPGWVSIARNRSRDLLRQRPRERAHRLDSDEDFGYKQLPRPDPGKTSFRASELRELRARATGATRASARLSGPRRSTSCEGR